MDGPGIRYVIFFQGCPMRCLYCHNRDTWDTAGGQLLTLEEVLEDVDQYKHYYISSGGGVTASGGEPTLQMDFLEKLFACCRLMGLNTVLDTSGYVAINKLTKLLELTDLIMLDIKHINPEKHRQLTGRSNSLTLQLAQHLAREKIPVWIRYVLIPGYTDNTKDLKELAYFIEQLGNVEKVDILPYHTMGAHKWELLGLKNPMAHVIPPSLEDVDRVRNLFKNLTAETHPTIH